MFIDRIGGVKTILHAFIMIFQILWSHNMYTYDKVDRYAYAASDNNHS